MSKKHFHFKGSTPTVFHCHRRSPAGHGYVGVSLPQRLLRHQGRSEPLRGSLAGLSWSLRRAEFALAERGYVEVRGLVQSGFCRMSILFHIVSNPSFNRRFLGSWSNLVPFMNPRKHLCQTLSADIHLVYLP